jgi:hypothetical protein
VAHIVSHASKDPHFAFALAVALAFLAVIHEAALSELDFGSAVASPPLAHHTSNAKEAAQSGCLCLSFQR